MALENVDLLFLFGFLSITIVLFEQGLQPSSSDNLPILYYNDAYKLCHNFNKEEINLNDKDLPVISDQGILYCKSNNTQLGFHIYREKPDQWFNIEARRCDLQDWCKNGDISKSYFFWKCNGYKVAVLWAGHNEDPCPPKLNILTESEAKLECINGTLGKLSKIWLCSSSSQNSINEIGWTNDEIGSTSQII